MSWLQPASFLLLIGAALPFGFTGGCSSEAAGDGACTPASFGCSCVLGSCDPGLICGQLNVCAIPGGSDDSESSGGSEGPAETGSNADAPVIVSLLTDKTILAYSSNFEISAIVTDPNGVEDLLGGQLLTPDGSLSYGNFTSTGADGAYTFVLSWFGANDVVPINYYVPGKTRDFRVEFYDQAANVVATTVTMTLDSGRGFSCNGSSGGGVDFCTPVVNETCPPGDKCSFNGSFSCGAAGTGLLGATCSLDSSCAVGYYCSQGDLVPGGCSTERCCTKACTPKDPSAFGCEDVPGSTCRNAPNIGDSFDDCADDIGACQL